MPCRCGSPQVQTHTHTHTSARQGTTHIADWADRPRLYPRDHHETGDKNKHTAGLRAAVALWPIPTEKVLHSFTQRLLRRSSMSKKHTRQNIQNHRQTDMLYTVHQKVTQSSNANRFFPVRLSVYLPVCV